MEIENVGRTREGIGRPQGRTGRPQGIAPTMDEVCTFLRSIGGVFPGRILGKRSVGAVVCEPDALSYPHEDDVAQRWYALAPGTILRLSNGDTCELLFAGRPGGASGPDVRDAILSFSDSGESRSHGGSRSLSSQRGRQVVGDVEFHVRASDWFAHEHHTDARYNNVVLHVVLICDERMPTQREDGAVVAVCSLYDLAHEVSLVPAWPCQRGMSMMSDDERVRLLRFAGLLRFEQKTYTFVKTLHDAAEHSSFSAYDVCLISALGEGLGYGRDRDFFRAAGLRLLGLPGKMPEPLGHTDEPPPLDASRLRVLSNLVEKWRVAGAWTSMRAILCSNLENSSSGALLAELRLVFRGLSTGRADILICNVVLPFAAAAAFVEGDELLAERAQKLFVEHPGLPSNSVTRAMCRQLQLEREPRGACEQQGLHYIYAQTCREKLCGQCIAGKWGNWRA